MVLHIDLFNLMDVQSRLIAYQFVQFDFLGSWRQNSLSVHQNIHICKRCNIIHNRKNLYHILQGTKQTSKYLQAEKDLFCLVVRCRLRRCLAFHGQPYEYQPIFVGFHEGYCVLGGRKSQSRSTLKKLVLGPWTIAIE